MKEHEKEPSAPATEDESSETKRERAWENHKFRSGLLFAALVILIYVLITHLDQLGGKILGFLSLFSPLFIGVLLALVLNLPLKGFEKLIGYLNKLGKKRKKRLSERGITFISLVLTLVFAVLLIYVVGHSVLPQVIDSFKSIGSSVESYYPKALAYLENLGINTADLKELLAKIDLNEIWKALTENAGTIWDTARNTVNGLFNILTTIVTALIFAVYLLANRRNLKRQVNKMLTAYCKPETAYKVRYVGRLTLKTFSNFFSGQCLEAVILGTIFFVAMSIGQFPYAVVISVIIAVTALVPYVGAFIGCIIGAILIAMQSPLRALAFVVMFLIIQQLENNLIYPRVVGTSVGLPAIWTFAALIVGGAVYGVVGMILFIPLTSVIYSLLRADVNARIQARGDVLSEEGIPIDETMPDPPLEGEVSSASEEASDN
jgi:predicted PurR-regulated permease PerM